MSAFRILIADDHELVRRGIRALVEGHPGWEICGEATDGREAVEKAVELRADIVLLDIGMPNLNGLDAARQILAAKPRTRVLIVTMHESEQLIREALEIGARGFLLKSDAAKDLVAAVEALQRRATFFTSSVTEMVLNGYLQPRSDDKPVKNCLTAREREVVQLLAESKSSKEIAVSLDLSVKTVETHRTNVMRKLDLHSIAAVVRYAVRNNIVQELTLPPSQKQYPADSNSHDAGNRVVAEEVRGDQHVTREQGGAREGARVRGWPAYFCQTSTTSASACQTLAVANSPRIPSQKQKARQMHVERANFRSTS
jgi:DNA-binding NarL/FixJ family response regulator